MNIKDVYKKREADSHKGQFGYVLVVSGSKIYSGSPVFNAFAALRSGADLTTIVGHERAMNIAASFSPDLITYPLDGELNGDHVAEILDLSKKFDSLVIGGGLSRSEETYDAIRRIVSEMQIPMVLDAEAIRAVSADQSILKNKKVILTPNVPEFEVLSGGMVSGESGKKKDDVFNLAKKIGCTICLKGSVDLISDGENIAENGTGNVFMTKGGFGDTLAGICAALLARRVSPFEAAKIACEINGKAGDMAAEKFGEGVVASDIFDFIAKVIKGQLF